MIKVKSYKELVDNYTNEAEDTLAAVEISPDKFKVFRFSKGEWQPDKSKIGGLGMTAYEMNKQIVSQLPDYEIDKELLQEYFDAVIDSKYLMLLCNELKYYTIFHRDCQNNCESPTEVLYELLTSPFFKPIKSIEVKNKTSLEIWFIGEDKEAHIAYLFPYDEGVIECI